MNAMERNRMNNNLNSSMNSESVLLELQPPNILSINWIMLCLKTIIVSDPSARGVFDYVIYAISIAYTFIALAKNERLENSGYKTLYGFLALFFISVLGIVFNPQYTAITSVLGVVCVGCFVLSCGFFCNSIQVIYVKPFFYATVIRLLLRTLNGEYLNNTIPAVLCFLTFGYIICLVNNWNDSKMSNQWLFKTIDVLFILCSLCVMIFVAYKASSRTPIFTTVGIFAIFIVYSLKGTGIRNLDRLFWFFIIALIALITLYINVRTYSWYNQLNVYSVAMFGKNIDSSRPNLWKHSIESLKWWQFVVGSGTGVLPNYLDKNSFHNTYIQLLMQNGIIGIVTLIAVFKSLWDIIVTNQNRKIVLLMISVFMGIVVYNAFESTLLQNKVFLGLTEWIVLCMGVVSAKNTPVNLHLLQKER